MDNSERSIILGLLLLVCNVHFITCLAPASPASVVYSHMEYASNLIFPEEQIHLLSEYKKQIKNTQGVNQKGTSHRKGAKYPRSRAKRRTLNFNTKKRNKLNVAINMKRERTPSLKSIRHISFSASNDNVSFNLTNNARQTDVHLGQYRNIENQNFDHIAGEPFTGPGAGSSGVYYKQNYIDPYDPFSRLSALEQTQPKEPNNVHPNVHSESINQLLPFPSLKTDKTLPVEQSLVQNMPTYFSANNEPGSSTGEFNLALNSSGLRTLQKNVKDSSYVNAHQSFVSSPLVESHQISDLHQGIHLPDVSSVQHKLHGPTLNQRVPFSEVPSSFQRLLIPASQNVPKLPFARRNILDSLNGQMTGSQLNNPSRVIERRKINLLRNLLLSPRSLLDLYGVSYGIGPEMYTTPTPTTTVATTETFFDVYAKYFARPCGKNETKHLNSANGLLSVVCTCKFCLDCDTRTAASSPADVACGSKFASQLCCCCVVP